MIRARLTELAASLEDYRHRFVIARRATIAALSAHDSLGLPAQAQGRARPGDCCGAVSQGVPTPTDSLGTAEGEGVHPGSESHGTARAEVPPRGVPATAAAQIERYRDALQEIATRSGCSGEYGPDRCLDGVARKWWCPSCIAADALTDREAVWP